MWVSGTPGWAETINWEQVSLQIAAPSPAVAGLPDVGHTADLRAIRKDQHGATTLRRQACGATRMVSNHLILAFADEFGRFDGSDRRIELSDGLELDELALGALDHGP